MSVRHIHIFASSLLLAAAVLTSCHREDNPITPSPQTDIPIALSASTHWPNQTKTLITAKNVTAQSFSVWADRTYNGATEPVFTSDKVWYDNGWTYDGAKYWQLGDYSFAAVMPSLETLNPTSDPTSDPTGTFSNGALTLDFTTSPFTLGGITDQTITSQIDLMAAFPDPVKFEDIDSPPTAVALEFNHLLSLMDIKITTDAADKSFEVSEVKVYGLYKSLKGSSVQLDYESLRGALSDLSTDTDPYYSATYAGDDIKMVKGEALVLENLLVFPQTLSQENPLYVSITYGPDKKVSTVKIPTGDWISGNKYTYTIDIDAVKVGDPQVSPWPTDYTAQPEVDIK